MATLVTGAAGFIGSHVVDSLLAARHDVIALDDLSGGFARNCPPGAKFVQGSILDVPLLSKIFAEHPIDFVFHLAAYAAEGLSHFIRNFNYTNNVVGSMNVLNQAVRHGVKCFVFTSSIAVYGPAQTPMREDTVPTPQDPYGIAKYTVEMDLHAAHHMFGIPSIIFRPHNVYGPRQHIGDRYRNVIGIFMNQLMRGEPMTLFGDGSQTREFTYIGDVPLIARSIELPQAYNQTFNIGGDETTTVSDLATIVAQAMNLPRSVRHLDARKEVQHAIADHSKLAAVFNFRPQYTLRQGVGRMAEWARKIGPQSPSIFSNIEVDRELPPSWQNLNVI